MRGASVLPREGKVARRDSGVTDGAAARFQKSAYRPISHAFGMTASPLGEARQLCLIFGVVVGFQRPSRGGDDVVDDLVGVLEGGAAVEAQHGVAAR